MSAKNLLRKHELVQSEINAHEPQIDSVVSQANKLVEEGGFSACCNSISSVYNSSIFRFTDMAEALCCFYTYRSILYEQDACF